MGAGASQQYGADPYQADATDPWRRRQGALENATGGYPAYPAYPGLRGSAAPPMHPVVQWGFAEAGKSHRIPQTPAYAAPSPVAPAYSLVPQPHGLHHGYAPPGQYAEPYQVTPYQHTQPRVDYDSSYAQPRVDPHAEARLTAARSAEEVVRAARMLEHALRPLAALQAALAPQVLPPQAPPPQAPPPQALQALPPLQALQALPPPQAPSPQAPPPQQQQQQAPLAASEVAGSRLEAFQKLETRVKELEAFQKLESRVKELEAQLAAPLPPAPPVAALATAAPKRTIERKPQTAPRMHSRPKPAAPADGAAEEESFAGAERAKWAFPEVRYGGAYSFTAMGRKEQVEGEIAAGIEAFKAAPHKYAALWYQARCSLWRYAAWATYGRTCYDYTCYGYTCYGCMCFDHTCSGHTCSGYTCSGYTCYDNTCSGHTCSGYTCYGYTCCGCTRSGAGTRRT